MSTAFEFLETYLLPVSGPISIPCGTRSVLIDGKRIQYAELTISIEDRPDVKIITLDGDGIRVEFKPGVHVWCKRFDVERTDTFAVGVAGPFGVIAYRKKINLSFEDA